MKLRTLGILAAAVVAAGVATRTATANSITLADLLVPGATITVDDKVFSNFSYSVNGIGTYTAPAASGITVSPLNLVDGEEGISFNAVLGTWSASDGGGVDIKIYYTVTATEGNLIHDLTLNTAGAATYNANWVVTETATPNVGTALTEEQTAPPPGFLVDPAHLVFGSDVTSLRVLKDINIYGGTIVGPPPSTASISEIDQTFSQTVAVPLPAAVWPGLGMLGLAGLGLLRRRRLI